MFEREKSVSEPAKKKCTGSFVTGFVLRGWCAVKKIPFGQSD